MRIIAMCMAMAMAGCSMSAMKTLGDWSGRSEPECSESVALAIGDALLSGVGIFGVLVAFDTKQGEDPNVGLAVGGGATALLFAISSLYGENAASECKAARVAWKVHEATR